MLTYFFHYAFFRNRAFPHNIHSTKLGSKKKPHISHTYMLHVFSAARAEHFIHKQFIHWNARFLSASFFLLLLLFLFLIGVLVLFLSINPFSFVCLFLFYIYLSPFSVSLSFSLSFILSFSLFSSYVSHFHTLWIHE